MATLQPNKDAEVTIQVQGSLVRNSNSETFVGVGQEINRLIVPVGKVWLIKNLYAYYAGTFTAGDGFWRLWTPADAVTDLEIFASAPTSGTTKIKNLGEQDIYLPAGWKIGTQSYISANTNGASTVQILYQEMDS